VVEFGVGFVGLDVLLRRVEFVMLVGVVILMVMLVVIWKV
jgi:hypothetical protein